MNTYSKNFFHDIEIGSLQSAKEIVPIIINLIKPNSVVDIGCGTGVWLSVFSSYGVNSFLGVDGSYVNKEQLRIPKENFFSHDLRKPLIVENKFDLVISLEVAEHLSSKYSEIFIDSLISLGPVIVFSAAIPFQGGNNHKNEQWPEYWNKLFKRKGYIIIDCIRNKVWNNDKVEWWYAQNIFIFVKEDKVQSYPQLREELLKNNASPLSVIHPRKYLDSLYNKSLVKKIKNFILTKMI